jgi:hypothetical protein
VGQLDQFAKATFAIDTPQITGGAIVWEGPKEVGLTEVRLDGLLSVRAPERLDGLPAPWCDAARHADVVVEIKMPGDHLHPLSILRAELRRAAWHVRRAERENEQWDGRVGLWHVAPHVPDVLRRLRPLHRTADGCYAVDYPASPFWWIAANELPLEEALIPFLIARSGKALVELGRWLVGRRSPAWLFSMLESLPMDDAATLDILAELQRMEPPPELRAQRERIARQILQVWPFAREEVERPAREEGMAKGELKEARKNLRRVLARRGLAVSPEQDTRIEACSDLSELERWLDQAVTAASATEALS